MSDFKSLIDNSIIEFVKVEKVEGESIHCNECGFVFHKEEFPTGVRRVFVRDLTSIVSEPIPIILCRTCFTNSFEKIDKTKIDVMFSLTSYFDSCDKGWDSVAIDEDDVLSKIRKNHPKMFECLSQFRAGEVTLSDGKQHELLESIYNQIEKKLKYPTDKQINAFCKVFKMLKTKKERGEELHHDADNLEIRVKSAEKLLGLGNKHLSMFTEPAKKVIISMRDQFKTKGALSNAQINYLKSIIEMLPLSCFKEE